VENIGTAEKRQISRSVSGDTSLGCYSNIKESVTAFVITFPVSNVGKTRVACKVMILLENVQSSATHMFILYNYLIVVRYYC
jgi:hypothetical protein